MKMSESLNDAVFWLLPPQSPSDDVVFVDKESGSAPVAVEKKHALKSMNWNWNLNLNLNPSLVFPTEFPYEFDSFDSALSSPVDSVLGSTETETTSSDEEDFLAGLTQRLTRKLEKSWGSPESTLRGLGSMSVSSNGSPNSSSSLVSSPPTTPFGGQNDTWDLISAAAGQIARLKMSNGSEAAPSYTTNVSGHGTGILAPPRNSSPVRVIKNPYFGFYCHQSVHFDPAANTNQGQYQQYVKQEQVLKAQSQRQQMMRPQQIQQKARNFGYVNGRCGQQQPLSAWPPLQKPQQQRPVFVAGSGCVRRGCAGTGVFLPRRYGNINNPHDSRKKSGSPNTFLPTAPTPTMNGPAQQRFDCSFRPNYEIADAMIARRNALITLQKRSLIQEAARNHEIHLPKEWTY